MAENLLSLNVIKLLKIIIFFLIIFVIFLIFYFPNYARLKKLKYTNQKLQLQIDQLSEEIKDLESKVKVGNKDPFLLEKFVRNELGVAKDDEIVIDILE